MFYFTCNESKIYERTVIRLLRSIDKWQLISGRAGKENLNGEIGSAEFR